MVILSEQSVVREPPFLPLDWGSEERQAQGIGPLFLRKSYMVVLSNLRRQHKDPIVGSAPPLNELAEAYSTAVAASVRPSLPRERSTPCALFSARLAYSS